MFVRAVWDLFEKIPLILRLAAAASIGFGLLFPIFTLIPSATFHMSGRAMSHTEVWETGVGWAILFGTAPLMLGVGLGIVFEQRWVRPILIALPLAQLLPFQIAHWVADSPPAITNMNAYLITCGVWGVVASAYLFGYRPARQYFAHDRA